jgi:hypothetical protein
VIIPNGTTDKEQLRKQSWQTARAGAKQGLIAQEQQQKADRGLLGSLIGGIVDPFARLGEAGLAMSAGTPESMSFTSQEAYKEDPNKFALQRLADLGSAVFTAVAPGTGNVLGSAALGALGGGLGAVGGAGKDEDLINAGLTGALTGGAIGGAIPLAAKGLGAIAKKISPATKKLTNTQLASLGVGKEAIKKGGFGSLKAMTDWGNKVDDVFVRRGGAEVADAATNIATHNTALQSTYDDLSDEFAKSTVTHNPSELVAKIGGATKFAKGNKNAALKLDEIKESIAQLFGDQPITSAQLFDFIDNGIDPYIPWGATGKDTAQAATLKNIREILRKEIATKDGAVSQALTDLSVLKDVGGRLGTAYKGQQNIQVPVANVKLPVGSSVAKAGIAGEKLAGGLGGLTKALTQRGSDVLGSQLMQRLTPQIARMVSQGGEMQGQEQGLGVEETTPTTGLEQLLSPETGMADQRAQVGMQLLAQGMKPADVKVTLDIMGLKSPKQLTSSQITALSDTKDAINSVNRLGQIFQSTSASGPITGRVRALNPFDVEAQDLKQVVNDIKQTIGKAKEGGVLRKEDEEKYKAILPSINDTREVALRKVERIRTGLISKYNTYITSTVEAGYEPYLTE